MITFNITNIVQEGNKILVWYVFSNGYEWSNRFSANASVLDLMKWGNDQVAKFEEDKLNIENKVEVLQEELIQ